jgi:hypothetical protein
METEGLFAPETRTAARQRYETLAPAAGAVVRETARAMSFDSGEYDRRVTGEVVDTAREALFASLLEVMIGTRKEYQEWCDAHQCEPIELGSGNVDNAVWHAAPFAEAVVAATFQNEPDAAIDTLRRQAFNRIYSDILADAPGAPGETGTRSTSGEADDPPSGVGTDE